MCLKTKTKGMIMNSPPRHKAQKKDGIVKKRPGETSENKRDKAHSTKNKLIKILYEFLNNSTL
jgi:hypothetical protein